MNTFFFGYLSLKWRRLIRVVLLFVTVFWIYLALFENNNTFDTNPLFTIPIPFLSIALISWLAKPFITDNSTFIVPKFFKHLFFISAIGILGFGFEESNYGGSFSWDNFIIYICISLIIIFFLWKFNYFTRNKS